MTDVQHPKKERTFVILKPDALQRSLAGEIIGRFEAIGLKVVAMKMLVPTVEQVEKHYTLDPNWKLTVGTKSITAYQKQGHTPPSNDPIEVGNMVLGHLCRYLTSGPVIAMIWEGSHAVEIVRKLCGSTEPRSSDVGTIRGDFVMDSYSMSDSDGRSIRNLIHASGTKEEATNEIALWFKPEEVIDYRHVQEAILYGVSIDAMSE
jgi:nucleoside-diphosphate kinase